MIHQKIVFLSSHVLAGDTFSNDNDTGLVGTMIKNNVPSTSLAINGSYTIPEGYHPGTEKVIQNIPTKAAATISPSTVAQTIVAGQYLSGDQTIAPITGTATISDVVVGKTFNSAAGIGLTGTATKLLIASGTINYQGSQAKQFINVGFKIRYLRAEIDYDINKGEVAIFSESIGQMPDKLYTSSNIPSTLWLEVNNNIFGIGVPGLDYAVQWLAIGW